MTSQGALYTVPCAARNWVRPGHEGRTGGIWGAFNLVPSGAAFPNALSANRTKASRMWREGMYLDRLWQHACRCSFLGALRLVVEAEAAQLWPTGEADPDLRTSFLRRVMHILSEANPHAHRARHSWQRQCLPLHCGTSSSSRNPRK